MTSAINAVGGASYAPRAPAGRPPAGGLDRGAFRDYDPISDRGPVRSSQIGFVADSDGRRSAYHRVVAAGVSRGMTRYDAYPVLDRFLVHCVPHLLYLLLGHLRREIEVDGEMFRRKPRNRYITEDDM